MSQWKRTVQAAKGDATLCGLAVAIQTANKSGTPDRLAYGAFTDRCQDLGLRIPNVAYYSILLWCLIAAK